MRIHRIALVFGIVFFCLFIIVHAISFDLGFGSLADKLQKIREANLKMLEAKYYSKLGNKVIQCHICPNNCTVPNGGKGFCGTRINVEGKYYSLVYASPVAVHIDPIEKKPLSHVLPGTMTYSIATAGCNFGCLYCQNWQISQAKPEVAEHQTLYPKDIVRLAREAHCPSISYTYTEPTIFYEYMLETAKLAKAKGLKNFYHSNGYINQPPLKELLKYLDGAVIDLKGFSEKFYQEMCKGHLAPVLETLKTIKKSGKWLEIVNLIIPGKNDDPKMIKEMCQWIKANLGDEVPVYFSAFTPLYQLKDVPPTPVKTLEGAAAVAKGVGLKFVYIGNVYGHSGENTYCPKCGRVLIKRSGYTILENNIIKGKCKFCGYKVPGIWQ